MLKFFSIIFLFVFSLFFSQSHRFIYSYKFIPDSTKIDSVLVEKTRLEIFNDHSEFISELNAKRDSALTSATSKNQSQASVQMVEGVFKNNVYKSKKLIYSIEYIGIQPFKVLNKQILNWKLSKETKNVQGYNCQKALLNYGGRNWEAWFTQEIPIQDGPYIFAKLPGLVVQVNDTNNQHSFTLEENYKIVNSITNFVEKRYFVPFTVSSEQFTKKWNVYRKNPIGGTEQFMIMNPGLLSGQSFDTNGNEIDQTQKKRDEQKYAQKLVLKNNNFINLNLYK